MQSGNNSRGYYTGVLCGSNLCGDIIGDVLQGVTIVGYYRGFNNVYYSGYYRRTTVGTTVG